MFKFVWTEDRKAYQTKFKIPITCLSKIELSQQKQTLYSYPLLADN
jgi:hypothetical protein